jgi:hypothetical protein
MVRPGEAAFLSRVRLAKALFLIRLRASVWYKRDRDSGPLLPA